MGIFGKLFDDPVVPGKLPGGCGDPSLVSNALGGRLTSDQNTLCPTATAGTIADPFGITTYCNTFDYESWYASAKALLANVSNTWAMLVILEQQRGVSTQQFRLQASFDQLVARFNQIEEAPTWINLPAMQSGVVEIVAWIADAACMLEQMQQAVRSYNVAPPPVSTVRPPAPTPSPVGQAAAGLVDLTKVYKPSSVAERVGRGVLLGGALALLVGGVYLYTKSQNSRLGGLGRASRRPLPPLR